MPVKHSGIVDKLIIYAVKGRDPFPLRAERLIQEVFARCVVDHSVQLGLIPHPLDLVLAGDSSPFRTGASHFGVKVCDCRKNGVFNWIAHVASPTPRPGGAGTVTARSIFWPNSDRFIPN